jgi:hypothetical protein
MTPAPRFTESDAKPAVCDSTVDANCVLRKLLAGGIEAEPAPCGTNVVSALAWLVDGAEVEPAVGGIEAEPAPCGTNVVSALAWLVDGAEVEPAVGGMSLQSQPMPGSHPLLGQRPLPAVWPALEALSDDTQLGTAADDTQGQPNLLLTEAAEAEAQQEEAPAVAEEGAVQPMASDTVPPIATAEAVDPADVPIPEEEENDLTSYAAWEDHGDQDNNPHDNHGPGWNAYYDRMVAQDNPDGDAAAGESPSSASYHSRPSHRIGEGGSEDFDEHYEWEHEYYTSRYSNGTEPSDMFDEEEEEEEDDEEDDAESHPSIADAAYPVITFGDVRCVL